ncbi:MAG: hypothetical protein V9H69_21750 [Anaerolineae bacterium]
MAKQILFLMSDTGGGHRASANALIEALNQFQGDAVQCRMVDLLMGYGSWPLSRAGVYYQPLVDRHLWLWQLMNRYSNQPLLWRSTARAARFWQLAGLRRFVADNPADLYVSVHPLLNHAPQWMLRQAYPHARFATVVTDLVQRAASLV